MFRPVKMSLVNVLLLKEDLQRCGTGGLSTSVLNHDGHGTPCPYTRKTCCIAPNTCKD